MRDWHPWLLLALLVATALLVLALVNAATGRPVW